jgi:hypothetical protein
MAIVNATRKQVITPGNTYILGEATNGMVGTWAVQFIKGTLATSQLTVQARVRGPEATADGITLQPINYLKVYVNGSVGDQTYGSATLTDNSLILIPASGLVVAIDVSSGTGLGTLYSYPLDGAAA